METMMKGRLPKEVHERRPWRIHALIPDFELEDVWALPTPGGPGDFPLLVEGATSLDPAASSGPTAILFAIRWKIGEILGWDDDGNGIGTRVPSLRGRLPADLRDGPLPPGFEGLPFSPLFMTGDEFAAEIANGTMHGVLHLGWVPDGDAYRGEMAVYVKPNGRVGRLYMAAIKPFRYGIVYPRMLAGIGRRWRAPARGR
jgi:hypothetical protein